MSQNIHGQELPKGGTKLPIPFGPLKGITCTVLRPGKYFGDSWAKRRYYSTLWVWLEGDDEKPILYTDGVELPTRYFVDETRKDIE